MQCAHSKGALAWCLVEGIGTEKNVAYALKLAEEGSKLNSPIAQNVLAYMLQNGIGVVRDLTKAFKIYAVAAKTFPQSQCNLAWMLQKASASGHALTQFNLEMMMRSGQGVRKNEDAALGLNKAAASQELPQAMLELATMHMEGKGGMRTKNVYQARLLLQRAAELEDPHAHFKLGEMHENGIGIEKNLRLAAHHFQQASQMGHDEATVKLGLITRAAAV
jgi:TPR repeat protein